MNDTNLILISNGAALRVRKMGTIDFCIWFERNETIQKVSDYRIVWIQIEPFVVKKIPINEFIDTQRAC